MASGDFIAELSALHFRPPSANGAQRDTVSDLSTPNQIFDVLDFDGATDEHADYRLTLPEVYSGTTGLTFKYTYAMDGTDADIVELEIRVLKLTDSDDLTSDLGMDTQTPVAIQDTPNGTANDFTTSPTGALAKANFGSAAAGDTVAIRITRDVSAATNTDDFQFLNLYITET